MAGTRSAPVIDTGAPDRTTLTVRLMDWDGDKRSVTLDISSLATDTQKDAYIDALQAASNATVYEVIESAHYTSVPDQSNTTNAIRESVFDNLVVLVKNTSINKSQQAYVPAVVGSLLLEGDAVDTDAALYTTFKSTLTPLLGANYAPVSVRFTERRDKNDSQPA